MATLTLLKSISSGLVLRLKLKLNLNLNLKLKPPLTSYSYSSLCSGMRVVAQSSCSSSKATVLKCKDPSSSYHYHYQDRYSFALKGVRRRLNPEAKGWDPRPRCHMYTADASSMAGKGKEERDYKVFAVQAVVLVVLTTMMANVIGNSVVTNAVQLCGAKGAFFQKSGASRLRYVAMVYPQWVQECGGIKALCDLLESSSSSSSSEKGKGKGKGEVSEKEVQVVKQHAIDALLVLLKNPDVANTEEGARALALIRDNSIEKKQTSV